MDAELEKKLKGWIFLRLKEENQPEDITAELILSQALSEVQIYGVAAGVILIDADTAEEVGKMVGELCDLGVDRAKLLKALERAAKAIRKDD